MPSAQHDRNAFKAGLFMLVSIGLIVTVVLGIKGVSRFIVPSQQRIARFKLSDDIGGLGEGDEVRIGGAKVGVVRSVDIETGEEGKTEPGIAIEFTMPSRYVIREGADVSVQSTVTGVSVLNFASLGSGKAIPDGQVIAGKPGGLTSLLASLGDIAPEVKDVVHDVRTTTVPKVNTTVDSANTLFRHVDAQVDPVATRGENALDQVGSLFGDSKSDFRGTLANLNKATGTIKDKLPDIMDAVQSALTKIDTTIERANDALLDIKEVAANTKDVTASARRIISGNRGKIEAMIVALRDASENLKGATVEIRRSPWRLLYKPSPGEMGNLNLYDSARQFAEGANEMSDAATALRDAMQSKTDDPQRLDAMLKKLDATFDHFTEVENQLWSQVKE